MEAIQLNHAPHAHPYACRSITVSPDPPQVGTSTTIRLALANPGPASVTVTRIDVMVARFGIGVRWEELPPIGPFQLPAAPDHVHEVTVEWTPTDGGHRCLRALIHAETLPRPLRIGRNLQVIESAADGTTWHVPFRLGNPENRPAPLVLAVGGADPAVVEARVLAGGHLVRAGQPVWLNPREELDAALILQARSDVALDVVRTVEATIAGRLVDGIQVVVRRPARSSSHIWARPQQDIEDQEPTLAAVC